MSRRALALAVPAIVAAAPEAIEAQVYGYTDDNGVLILSNVLTNDRMRVILEERTENDNGRVWRYTGEYDGFIQKAAGLFGVDSALVRAVIAVESAFNRYARSHKGALGLMQLMPDTGRRYGVANAFDPWQNIRGGTAHLRDLLDEFKDLRLALAAYNAGATPVRRHRNIPPYAETRDYVRKVLAIYGAGGKIEIVKGNRVYSIVQPGAQTRITSTATSPSTEPINRSGGSPLADLARRVRTAGRALPGTSPGLPSPSSTLAMTPSANGGPASQVYYRYVDPDGTVFITRDKPPTYPYEVLEP